MKVPSERALQSAARLAFQNSTYGTEGADVFALQLAFIAGQVVTVRQFGSAIQKGIQRANAAVAEGPTPVTAERVGLFVETLYGAPDAGLYIRGPLDRGPLNGGPLDEEFLPADVRAAVSEHFAAIGRAVTAEACERLGIAAAEVARDDIGPDF